MTQSHTAMNMNPSTLNRLFPIAAALAIIGLSACGGGSPKEASSPATPAASASAESPQAVNKAPEPKKEEAPTCFLEPGQASEYAHDLLISTLSSADFNKPQITRASTPENLKVIENSLAQQMMNVTCKKPYKDDVDTITGALLVLSLMKFEDKQWAALLKNLEVPQMYRVLPAETQEWLKSANTLELVKAFVHNDKMADDLLAAAAKELKCSKTAVSVKVKTSKLVDVDGCKKKATLKYDGGWKPES